MSGFAEGTPTVTVELGGKPRQLGFTMAAMRRCQEKGVLHLDFEDEMGMLIAVPAFVWACMEDADREELPFEEIELLMNPRNVRPYADKMVELFAASYPPDTVGNGQPPAARKPTGGKRKPRTSKHSGRRASTTSA